MNLKIVVIVRKEVIKMKEEKQEKIKELKTEEKEAD